MAKPRPGWRPKKPFPPGNSLGGRRKGSRGQYSKSIWQKLAQQGDRDPIEVLSEFVSSTTVDPNLKLQAAGMLASYKYGKRPAYRYIEDVVGLKAPTTIQEALAYQARMVQLLAEGNLDVDGAAALKDALTAFIESKVAIELAEKLERGEQLLREMEARGISAAQVVSIGGLPIPPGFENVRMPHLGPPTIEAKPNPWSDPTANVAAGVKTTPGSQKRPSRRVKSKPDSDPKTDPEGS
jgi:hypothetical protein